ncbi:hypothetical protein WKH57_01200 [Niallia taxi]|uniref:hypothetical protein n=1 Tax=Niallia taxi TaxID=2499688 RepID=UPI003172A1EE
MTDIIGMKAYKKRGMFSGLIGVIEESNNNITPYVIKVGDAALVPFRDVSEVEIIEKGD